MSSKISCPTCHKPHALSADSRLGPFCSSRCQLIDLGRWLTEDYRIPDAGSPPVPGDELDGPESR